MLADVMLKFEKAEVQMIKRMCSVSMKKTNRKTSEDLGNLVGVEPITTVIRRGRLGWYGYVKRKINKTG